MKSCPKCSSMGVVIRTGRDLQFYAVRCSKCDLAPHSARTHDQAVAMWNKRKARKKNDPTFKTELKEWHRARRAFLDLPAGDPNTRTALGRLANAEDALFKASAAISR